MHGELAGTHSAREKFTNARGLGATQIMSMNQKSSKFWRIGVIAGLLSAFIVCSALGAFAQSQASTGQIAGVVRDQAGALVSGATVTVSNVNTGFGQRNVTNDTGLFRFVLLPPGTYRLTVSAKGFAEFVAEDIPVEVGRVFDVNPKLTVGAAKETITVAAEGIEVTRHENSSFVNMTAVSAMPLNGRRFQDLVNLTPTAQTDPSRGQISIAGQRGINTNVTVDGLDYNQPFFGGIRGGERSNFAPTIPQDAIQEFQVVTTGYSAEFGRSTAGLITAVTRSGENKFHGSGSYYIRPKDLSPSTEYYDTVKENLADAIRNTTEVKPAPTQHQWGATLGGPFVTDKAFFFGSYNQQRVRATRTTFFDRLVGVTPTTAQQEAYDHYLSQQGSWPYTNDSRSFLGRFDFQLNPNNRVNVRYSYFDNNSENGVGVGGPQSISSTTSNALSNNGTEQDNLHTIVGQWSGFFGNMVNEFRGQYTREERPRPANVQSPTVTNTIGNYGTVNFLGKNVEHDWRLQFADSVTYQSGRHTWKFGAEYNHLYAAQLFGFNQYGTFGSRTSSVSSILSFMSVSPGRNRFDDGNVTYQRQIGNLEAAMSGDQIAAFVQDSWRILPNFTLNYGLRWEAQYNPQPEATNTNMVNSVKDFAFPNGFTADPTEFANQTTQFAPRLGFAWDPFNNSKTVIRGFGGIYYATTPLLLYAGPANNFRAEPGDLSLSLPFTGMAGDPAGACSTVNPAGCNTIYEQFNLTGIDLNTYGLGDLPIVTVDQIQSIASSLGLSPDPFFRAQPITMGKDYHNPRSYQAGFGIEHQVGQGWTVGMDVNWIKTVYLERNRELNLPAPVIRATDNAQRPYFGVTTTANPAQPRPITSLGSVQIRQDSAKSLYRGLTLKSVLNRKRYQLGLYYTLSQNVSDDDNERDSGGQSAVNSFDLTPEYSFSNLDRKHQFVAAPIVFLPWDFEVSSSMRFVSGAPITATQGTDSNSDNINNDRPFWAPGVPFQRNSFRNRAIYDINLRVQKAFNFGESKKLYVSSEFFNLFNLMNLTYSGTAVTNYCASSSVNCAIDGSDGNANFLQLRESRPGNAKLGQLLTNNNTSGVLQVQFGAKFVF